MNREERERGVITASSGNHGLGLSLASKRYGLLSVIVVPEIYVSSFDDPDIIAGNRSIGLEILEDVHDVKLIICPIGGGRGISGISLAVKQINPDIHVMGVEAEKAPSMHKSVEAGAITGLSSAHTFADGIAVRKPGTHTCCISLK